MMGNTYLQSLNILQKSLDEKLKNFERIFCESEDISRSCVIIDTQTYPAINGDSINIHVKISNCDWWTKYWHARFCKEFNVHLKNYHIMYSTDTRYLDSERSFTYVYAFNDENNYYAKKYEDRLDGFFYKPRNLENNQYWNVEDKTRVLVHSILNKLRECDDLDLDYEDYIDKDCLFIVSEQLDCCLRYKDKLKR